MVLDGFSDLAVSVRHRSIGRLDSPWFSLTMHMRIASYFTPDPTRRCESIIPLARGQRCVLAVGSIEAIDIATV